MAFWRDLVFPIILLVIAVGGISFALNLLLRALKIDMTIIRIMAFFAIWYFVGPIIYNWLINHVVIRQYEAIKILYEPIQYIIHAIEKLV